MKIDPNNPSDAIREGKTGLSRSELAARFMAAMLSDHSNLASFPKGFSIFDSKTQAEDKATKAIIDFMELMSKISILGADTLISQLNKTAEDGK